MATPTSPSQDRSRQRRDALLRAAIALLAQGGARAVTHRAVAAEAGVPLAATTYYFESIQQLTDEALRLHIAERADEVRAIARAATSGDTTAAGMIAGFVEALMSRDKSATIAQFEVYLEAARDPKLQPAVASALDASEELARPILAMLGARDPDRAAASLVALVNGFAVHSLARPTDADAANLLSAIRALLIVELMAEEELAPFIRRLERPTESALLPQ